MPAVYRPPENVTVPVEDIVPANTTDVSGVPPAPILPVNVNPPVPTFVIVRVPMLIGPRLAIVDASVAVVFTIKFAVATAAVIAPATIGAVEPAPRVRVAPLATLVAPSVICPVPVPPIVALERAEIPPAPLKSMTPAPVAVTPP